MGCGTAHEEWGKNGLDFGSKVLPLTTYQAELARLLATNRSEDSHLAGGAALLIEPNSLRFSNDLDYFNDSDIRVAKAFEDDSSLLKRNGYQISIEITQPGYIRATVSKRHSKTKIEWAHDSAWRFLPVVKDRRCGYRLHPIDLAINKVLTLAGRNEPRDLLDTLHSHETILPLGALCWAAPGKDPGFSPKSILELLKRRGRFQKEDFDRLHLVRPVQLEDLKKTWQESLENAENFVNSRPHNEVGCLYYTDKEKIFFMPASDSLIGRDYQTHFGKPGGVIPIFEETKK